MKKKERILIIGLIILLIIAIVGVSYAAFNYSKTGTKINSITTGKVTMTYTESDNVIKIDKALPTTDETGKVRLKEGEYFDFTVSSEIVGDININYEISAKDVTDSGARKIDGSNIKLYLTRLKEDGTEEELMSPETYNEEVSSNEYTGRPTGEMSLYQGSMNSSETNKYRLRMYVDEKYNPQGDGGNLTFSIKINVYGKDGDVIPSNKGTVAEVLLSDSANNINTIDPEQTFITGEEPNNYIWYSGKLWRAVSIDPNDMTVKLITQWNISTVSYDDGDGTAFDGSQIEMWLNDTSVDGFLGNLRNPEKFIVMDSKWNATMTTETTKPEKTTMIEDPIGLLNIYEYTMSYSGTNDANGYLNNGLLWWSLAPYSLSDGYAIYRNGSSGNDNSKYTYGARPAINLKSNILVASGSGTEDDPYRLVGDNDTNLSGVKLNTRYSGEYIRFGAGENNLYRIVSHETENLTKIVSEDPMKDSGGFKPIVFGSDIFGSDNMFSKDNTIGSFLNNDFLNPSNGYLTNEDVNMVEDNTTWYLGQVDIGENYRLAKYTDINMNVLTSNASLAKVGLLRLGELVGGQFKRNAVKGGSSNTNLTKEYWTLTPGESYFLRSINASGSSYEEALTTRLSFRPSLNLKSNVVIASGTGTKSDPFQIKLG